MKNERFTEVYHKYAKLVMKIAYDRLGDMLLAEEISQQVFVSFYEHMGAINEQRCKPWLMIAARNAAIDYLRKRQTQTDKAEWLHVDAAERVPEEEEHVIERIDNERLTFQILDDLRERNEEWYQAIVAVCVEGMSQREAAKYLRMTPQVLNAKLYRAKQYIRKKYRAKYPDD